MSKKSEKKQQQKVIQDRTFGLKNKNKSKTVQKFIKGVVNTVKNQGKSVQMLEAEEIERRKQKKKQQEQQALMKSLYQTVDNIKAAADDSQQEVDPKDIVCPLFKQGLCQKGKKCKYSHDLTLDRGEDLDLYVDQRTQLIMNEYSDKQMKQWDEQKLMEVIKQKQKAYVKQKPTQIVCKYFLDALQKGKYNWNWQCQNGTTCHYRHCLPPGFVLKKLLPKNSAQDNITIEQQIDAERAKLFASEEKKSQLVTYEVFLKWKEEKQRKRAEEMEKKKKEDEKKGRAGGKQHLLSGRALFQFDPTLFVDDQQAIGENVYAEREEVQEEEGEQEVKHLDEGEKQELQKLEEGQEQEEEKQEEEQTN